VSRFEVAIAVVTFIGVLALGVLVALVIAVALSIVDYLARSAKPHDAVLGWVPRLGRYANVALHPSALLTPGVVVYRFDGKLFFANAHYFSGRVLEAIDGAPTDTRWVVLDAEGLNGVDASGVEVLEQLVQGLRAKGVAFVVARLKSPVRDVFDASGLTELIGRARFPPSVDAGVKQCLGPDASPGRAGDPT
jgi:anti-anti-sigma factor